MIDVLGKYYCLVVIIYIFIIIYLLVVINLPDECVSTKLRVAVHSLLFGLLCFVLRLCILCIEHYSHQYRQRDSDIFTFIYFYIYE